MEMNVVYWHRQGIDIPAAKRHDDRITYIRESFMYIFIYIWAHVCTAKNHIYIKTMTKHLLVSFLIKNSKSV